MKNYYEILEVSNKASLDIIQKVFKLQVKKYHPDVVSDDKKNLAESKIKELNEAYEILSDKNKRAEYDELLKTKNYEDNFSQKEKVFKEQIEYLKKQLEKKEQIIEHFLGGLDLSEYDDSSNEDIETKLNNINDNIPYENSYSTTNQDTFATKVKQNNIPYNENPKNFFQKVQNFFSSSRPYKNIFEYYLYILTILLIRVLLLAFFITICFVIISFITKVNVFEIFINVFLKN